MFQNQIPPDCLALPPMAAALPPLDARLMSENMTRPEHDKARQNFGNQYVELII